MATDATGTPTSPDNIPTYNTSVDAPSGLGFNAAMAAIQTALSAKVTKPAGIVSGEAPVWNGATWDRSSVTKLSAVSLTNAVFYDSQNVSAANTDLPFNGGSAARTHMELVVTGTSGTIRSMANGAFNGQVVVLRQGGATGTRVQVLYGTAGGSGAQFSTKAGLGVSMGAWDSLTLMWNGTVWVEIDRDSVMSYGQWGGTTNSITNNFAVMTLGSVEALTDQGGVLSKSGTTVTVNRDSLYQLTGSVSPVTVPTLSETVININGASTSATPHYGTFGEPLSTAMTGLLPAGTTIQLWYWSNTAVQSVFGRLRIRELGMV